MEFLSLDIKEQDALFFLEMGEIYDAQGNDEYALKMYIKGLEHAKKQRDRARIQQFSNLISLFCKN